MDDLNVMLGDKFLDVRRREKFYYVLFNNQYMNYYIKKLEKMKRIMTHKIDQLIDKWFGAFF